MKIYWITAFCVLFFCSSAFSQNQSLEVVNTERAFAKTSREQGMKTAFLSFLAPDGVVFAQGEVLNGIASWNKRPDNKKILLDWWPVFADAATSGDLGYTTGPFKVFRSREDKTPVAVGYYSTVWKKQSDGSWKAIADLGIGIEDTTNLPHELKMATTPSSKKKKQKQDFVSAEKNYNDNLNERHISIDPAVLASEFRVHRNLKLPMTTVSSLEAFRNDTDIYHFATTSSGTSKDKDFGYSYGVVTITKKDNPDTVVKSNYMRVWRLIDGSWKIVLDVIGN